MKKMSMIYDVLLEQQAEDIMNEALILFMKQRLYEQIDTALMQGDKAAFYALTNKLKTLQEGWQSEA